MAIPDREVYATQQHPLMHQLQEYLNAAQSERVDGQVYALIVPDTNRLSGGRVAAQVYKLLEGRQYDTVFLIAPSHSGAFNRITICSVDTYTTPLGTLKVNDQVRHELCDEDDDIYIGDSGHFHAEGIDVQLPYVQLLLDSFDIVPIVMGDESPEFCRELGHAVGEISYNRRSLVIASANVLDASDEALTEFRELFEAGDVSRLMGLLNSERVHLEGKGPVLVALIAALHRRAEHARVLAMEPPRNGDPGYIGAVLWK